MSKKRPLPASNPPTKPQPADIEATQQNPPQAQASQSTRKSWVWKYFTPEPKADKVRCTAIMKKTGAPCNTLLAWDRSASTKSMSEHLFRIHQILDPSKVETGSHNIQLMIKKQKTNENASSSNKLTSDSLKKAIAYLIADTDLPFASGSQTWDNYPV
ncbi:hypothetical protein PCANC_20210 [Puccinia coronata f. sp. avenae]|uniref:BED-type domain-containing protein n=1 Tax=Puccinia coronata f. sp. avenae TaxID=200324 RepID=A0A2N5U3V0_9BASI|nr:hypothetical protein PCANC_20210 [Puccinia coronata f. sp. avenae]